MSKITHSELLSWLRYDIETGEFFWLKDKLGRGCKWLAGEKAGYVVKGAMNIALLGEYYYSHRLAWFYVFGEWPQHEVDHINGDWSDNRICNLRDVPHCMNMENMRSAKKTSVSGLIGAFKRKDKESFTSKIQIRGKVVYIGSFETAQEAHEAYVIAKRELHEGCTL